MWIEAFYMKLFFKWQLFLFSFYNHRGWAAQSLEWNTDGLGFQLIWANLKDWEILHPLSKSIRGSELLLFLFPSGITKLNPPSLLGKTEIHKIKRSRGEREESASCGPEAILKHQPIHPYNDPVRETGLLSFSLLFTDEQTRDQKRLVPFQTHNDLVLSQGELLTRNAESSPFGTLPRIQPFSALLQ